MTQEIAQLQAQLVERMRELGAPVNDPRLAPMVSQLQALMHQHYAAAIRNTQESARALERMEADADRVDGPVPDLIAALQAHLRGLAEGYIRFVRTQRVQMFGQGPALSETETGRALLQLAAADKATVAVQAYAAWTSERYGGRDGSALRRIVSDLFRAKLELTDSQAIVLVEAAKQQGFDHTSYTPNQAVVNVLKRHVEVHGVSAGLREALSQLRKQMADGCFGGNAEGRKLMSAVEALLAHEGPASGSEPGFKPKPDAWGRAVASQLAVLSPKESVRLTGWLALAAKGGESAKPAKGWLKNVEKELASASDRDRLGAVLLDVIEAYEPGSRIELDNQNTLRALLWFAALAAPENACRRLEAYAQKCLTFSPQHFAYLSLVLGNAAIHAFSLMPGTAGVGSLSRLKRRLKRPGEIKTVDKALNALASARGMTAGELEEIGLPHYGFVADGTLDIPVGPASARLTIAEDGSLQTSWSGADGRALSGPPAAVKDQHAGALKAFKAQAKEISETLKAQRLRLERLYLDDRVWPLQTWQARYLDEPLVANLARRLIWSFEVGGSWIPLLPEASDLLDANGARLDFDRGKARVKLWHPMQSDAGLVLAWRRRLLELGVTQPFKQAHREIYVLTDAERATGTYSNRFAGHIVEQHRFRALCQTRGWNCPAFGGWDPGNTRPLKRLAHRGMQVEFWVDPVETDVDEETFQFRYLTTDQVRFVGKDNQPIALEQVDPVLFSELMRDADLFVGVTSIGSDAAWGERDNGQFGGYWSQAAFGALSETGKTRRAVLEDLLPGLAIAPCCRLEERYLVVKGKLRTYRIHLGSGNIQMEPNSQYLCIVQDRTVARKNVRLPFEGDDTLSVIISKAFMLADDDKIKDASIRSQIAHGLLTVPPE